jgi:5'-nucleotidase
MKNESLDRSHSRPRFEAPHRFEQFIDKPHRIFVNRNLRLSSVRWIGFDMDHTLALYNRHFIEALAFDMAKDTLIQERGYPERLRQVRYDPDFGIRGLVVDKKHGNILKMDRFHYVAEAYHGRCRLEKEQRKELYTSGALKLSSDRFWSNDTLFGLPEISLYAGVVESMTSSGDDLDYRAIFDDIRYSVDLVHRNGSLKGVILERMSECFLPDPKLPATLEKLRRDGKRLFLLTNSDHDYTDAVLSHVLADPFLDRPWWEYFDLIVADSRKPGFFGDDVPWDESEEKSHGVPCFTGGNVQLLEEELGAGGDEILYVGDHIFGDILRSKKTSGWRTVMVVEELEHEIRAAHDSLEDNQRIDGLQMENTEIIEGLEEQRKALEADRQAKITRFRSLDPKDLAALDERLAGQAEEERQLDRRLTENLMAIKKAESGIRNRFNPYWGPLCKVDGELSRFGSQMEDFACLYTSRVSNFLNYSTDRYFRSPEEYLPHEI